MIKPKINLVLYNPFNKIEFLLNAYNEVIKSLYWGFIDLNFDCKVASDIDKTKLNIIFGWALTAESIPSLPKNTIFYNLEQAGDQFKNDTLAINIANNYNIWDFSKRALSYWKGLNPINEPYYAPIAFAPNLCTLRSVDENLDVMYFGKFAPHRLRKLKNLSNSVNGSVLAVTNLWDNNRDFLLSHSKVILNISSQNTYCNNLEMVRLQYLLANKKAVVCEKYPFDLEIEDDMKQALIIVDERYLSSNINKLLEDEMFRKNYADNCFLQFSKRDIRSVIKTYFEV